MYAADANSEFGMVVEISRLLNIPGHIPPAVVVGIGYDNPGPGLVASFAPRTLDLTPTVSSKELADVQDFAKMRGYPRPIANGGAPEFLDFIRSELVPYIESSYNVSHQDRAWFGHSYGGLFGIYALLHGDGLFQRFIIGSPTLDYDEHVMFKDEERYHAGHKRLPARIYFSVGGDEEATDDPMVSDMVRFATQLKERNYEGLELESAVFNGESHVSVITLAIHYGLRAIYRDAATASTQVH